MIKKILFFLFLMSVTVSLFAQSENFIDVLDCYGTWINPNYAEKRRVAKVVKNPDNTFESFKKFEDGTFIFVGNFEIEEMWFDDEGNIWYRAILYNINYKNVLDVKAKYYELGKFDSTSSVWEFNFKKSKYPERLDPSSKNYRIYYRETRFEEH